MEGGGTLKVSTGGSQRGGSSVAKTAPPPLRRRRTRIASVKRIADDEFMAAAIGDVEWLRQSLRETGGNINFDKNGLAALHLAAIHGRLECLKLCIEKFKMDINMASTTGWRTVHLAISNQTGKRSLTCMTYLLEKGADPSICNDDGISAVHQAASEGHVQCLKLLIEHGARVDGKDCRGNTPLDLAKLWGHRKCARILAAEIWHQDKDHVAQEMTKLKKVRMQQIMQEMDDEEEAVAAREFYGDQAFQQWLNGKHLDEKPTEPQNVQMLRQELVKPNSRRPEQQPQRMRVAISKPSSPEEKQDTDVLSSYAPGQAEDTENTEESSQQKDKPSHLRSRSKSPGFKNPNPWIFSPKLQDKDYVCILRDEFPRDEYTVMPRTGSAPKYYEGKHLQYVDVTDLEEGKTKKKELEQPDLPKEVIDRILSKDSSLNERPFFVKPKHIYDVHTKRKCEDQKPKSEAPLHLSHDLRSVLVKNSLQHTMSASSGRSSKSSTSSVSSEKLLETFPREMLINTMKQMSRPTHFPNVKGAEYVLNLGDLTGV